MPCRLRRSCSSRSAAPSVPKPIVLDPTTSGQRELNSGDLTLPADPTTALGAATKQSVDASSLVPVNAQSGTTYTFVLADKSKEVALTNAANITATVPPASSVAWPAGTVMYATAGGAGQVTIAAGAGVTLLTASSLKTRTQNATLALHYEGSDTWRVSGDAATGFMPGYIDGLKMVWVSATALTVTSGSAYIPGPGTIVQAATDIAKTGLTFTTGTWYHVYLFLNAGTPDIEIVTTAPATAYSGTARAKTSDTSRRYLGSVRALGTNVLAKFNHSIGCGMIEYQEGSAATPFEIATAANPTGNLNVAATAVVPITSRSCKGIATNTSTNIALIGTSELSTALSDSNWLYNCSATMTQEIHFQLDASQNLMFRWSGGTAAVSGGLFIRLNGYFFDR